MSHVFLEPIQVGTQTVKNRIIFTAMAKTLSSFNLRVTANDLAYITSIAEGGVGIVIPGAMAVDADWPSQLTGQPEIYDDANMEGFRQMVDICHENGAKILFQLWHPGQVDYSHGNPKTINDVDVACIKSVEQKFADAAKRAIRAGADGIEFQICHTYLGNQFLSPLWNHRTDEYGFDTLENRTRFCAETITKLREAIGPDKILAVKLQGFDFPEGEGPDGNDGINPDMAAEYAAVIEKLGVDLITVSAGGSLTGKDNIMTGDARRAEGWKVPAAEKVKAAVSIPVAASGGIRHPEFVDRIISDGKCDMVGMARGIFAEKNWVKKCEEGREDELRYCISCMNCWNRNPLAKDLSNCTVNPYGCRELIERPLVEDGDGRKVVIVGAGPAGLEAAVTLRQRGFEPIVFEKEMRLGGNINIAKKPPHKGKFQWQIDYYAKMVKKLGIEVRLGTEATAKAVRSIEPYVILIAAGSKVTAPPIVGLENADVLQSRDILDNSMKITGKKIVVIGGGIAGMETALYLNEQNNAISVVDMQPAFPLDQMAGDPRFMMEAKLETEYCLNEGISLYYNNKVLGFSDGKLNIESTENGEKQALAADLVVLSTGVKSEDALYQQLLAEGMTNVWKVGDSNKTAKIYNAVMNGSRFAVNLT
ncbi:MAG: NAD(P)/FAD-dependent oxidoreductase [Lachnospiraceae bacterium]|nr:NAD(P)/FAD-dependent oxidoreductase [Lachnospiraceae bacterium]